MKDEALMKNLEGFLIKKRGYVSRKPVGENVVLVISGGLDSTTVAAMLIEEYGCTVYPLFISRGQRAEKKEFESLQFFSNLYSKKYGKKFKRPQIVKVEIPPKGIKEKISKEIQNTTGHPMREAMILNIGVQYAGGLESEGIVINSVFNASHLGCGCSDFPHSRLLALRSQTINCCVHLDDWKWQVTSPILDPFITKPLLKSDLIIWATKRGIPIEKSWSCYEGGKLHCGICLACELRQRAHRDAGIEDKTNYMVVE